MQCPKCSGLLNPKFSQGVEVDVCVECGGVWLDRGELDKIIFAEAEPAVLASSSGGDDVQDGGHDAHQPPPPKPKIDSTDRPDKYDKSKSKKKKKKKDFGDRLEDILDDVLDLDLDDVFDFD